MRIRDDLLTARFQTFTRDTSMNNRAFRLLSAAVLLAAAAAPLRAQVQGGGRRVAAWVALSDAPIPGGEPSMVLRGAGPGHDDILVLPANADAARLSDAVRALLTLRAKDGDAFSQQTRFRARPAQGWRPARPAFPWTERVILDVRRAAVRELPGAGRVRAVRIWLPSSAAVRRAGLHATSPAQASRS
jgi:hypothetical protein